jgi:urease accessory protein
MFMTRAISTPAATDTLTSMTESLLPLLAWLSPTYPVGAYAYSHGLEWAIEAGAVTDETSLAAWLGDVLDLGAGRNDAILLAAAYEAAARGDLAALADVNDLALALAPSAELRLETRQQGRSFVGATLAAWPAPPLAALVDSLRDEIAYPVAVGLSAAAHSLPLAPTLEAFLLAFMQNLVSTAVRLAPIGQTGGTRVLAALAPAVVALARQMPDLTTDDIGGATFRADLGSFLHESQYTRLFRS